MVLRFIEGRRSARPICAANLDRLVPLFKICHREVGRACRARPHCSEVFHVIRRYVRLLSGRQLDSVPTCRATWNGPMRWSGADAHADRVRP